MASRVEVCEVKARAVIARMNEAIVNETTYAFSHPECSSIMALIDALRDSQAVDSGSNPLESVCPVCNGQSDEDDPCQACDGIGYRATKFGQQLINFAMRHILDDSYLEDVVHAPTVPQLDSEASTQ